MSKSNPEKKKSRKNPKVDAFLRSSEVWRAELTELRTLVLDCGLTEELKWRQPCYTFERRNVVIIGGFKKYCALSFFKGALLEDPKGILEKPGENTQSGRLIPFTTVEEIVGMEAELKTYVHEAIEVERAGLKVEFEKVSDLKIPEELQTTLNENAAFRLAFDALTPGRKKAYILHFSAPKQAKTRTSRIEKCTKRILDGMGLNDCICGQSKKLPYCDGSHKYV